MQNVLTSIRTPGGLSCPDPSSPVPVLSVPRATTTARGPAATSGQSLQSHCIERRRRACTLPPALCHLPPIHASSLAASCTAGTSLVVGPPSTEGSAVHTRPLPCLTLAHPVRPSKVGQVRTARSCTLLRAFVRLAATAATGSHPMPRLPASSPQMERMKGDRLPSTNSPSLPFARSWTCMRLALHALAPGITPRPDRRTHRDPDTQRPPSKSLKCRVPHIASACLPKMGESHLLGYLDKRHMNRVPPPQHRTTWDQTLQTGRPLPWMSVDGAWVPTR